MIAVILVIALSIRLFLIESYRISSINMEDKLLAGDYVFVSKISYGVRLPQTLLSLPFVHDSLNFFGVPAYSRKWVLPYKRIAPKKVKRNEIVLFNVPVDDKYDIPVDKRPIEVSRCVGLPGDTITWENDAVVPSINGHRLVNRPTTKQLYIYDSLYHSRIQEAAQRLELNSYQFVFQDSSDLVYCFLNNLDYYKLNSEPALHNVLRKEKEEPDTLECLLVPYKGMVISADSMQMARYFDLICRYEPVKAQYVNSALYINGQKCDEYEFCHDYYWMLSDNREIVRDSRLWGVIPETHLIGRVFMIWCSIDPAKRFPVSLRFHRLFHCL